MASNTQLSKLKEKPMKKFLIRREMEGAGSIPKHELNNAGKGSEEVLEAMRSEGKNIMQEQSYVVGDAIFCVYNSDSEDLIKDHSEPSGVPDTELSDIATVIKHNTTFVS
jgi:hypothetical protein